jgi:hypothetical protein
MGQVTIKQAAGIVRKRLQALQGAGQLPACLRFQVRATSGGKINITIDGYRDLIGTGDLDHEQADHLDHLEAALIAERRRRAKQP